MELGCALPPALADIVEEHVDRAEGRKRAGVELGERAGVGAIASDRQHAAVFGLRLKIGEPVRFAIDGGDARAFGEEAARGRRADAMRRAGDDDGLI